MEEGEEEEDGEEVRTEECWEDTDRVGTMRLQLVSSSQVRALLEDYSAPNSP